MKRFLRLIVLSLAVCTTLGPADAVPAASATGLSSADIFLIPAYTSYVTQITDDMLERFGCKYEATDPKIGDELFRLALAARRSPREPQGRPDRFEHRNKLVYRGTDGVRTTIAFEPAYTDAVQIAATWNGEPVWLAPGLHQQVRDIVRRMAATQSNAALPEACNRI